MQSVPTVLTVLTVLSACSSDPAAPPAALASLRVQGTVRNEAGAPVAGGYVQLHVWYDDTRKFPDDIDPSFVNLGSDGAFSISAELLEGLEVDSIGLEADPPGCHRSRSLMVIRAQDLPEGPAGEIAQDLVVPTVAAPATTAPSLLCAQGAEPYWGVGSFRVYLRIDETDGTVLSGRWWALLDRNGQGFRGTFAGVQQDGLVVLSLTQRLHQLGCTELRFVMPVGQAGEWGMAQIVSDDGCLPVRQEFRFMVGPDDSGL